MSEMDTVIRNDLNIAYGLAVREESPVSGGWMNRKWKIRTDKGTFLVKQFSRVRFGERQLRQIGDALVRQITVGRAGVPCPELLLPEGSGCPLRYLDDGTVYMVMTFCVGHMETPATVTEEQMYSLGSVCGQMHRAFGTISADGVKEYTLNGERLLRELADYCTLCETAMDADSPETFRRAVTVQKTVLDTLSPDFFARLPTGIAHEDFTPDNLLFAEDRVSAVLDFDRNCRSFLWHDVGRALLSLALNHGTMDPRKVRAFADGYAGHMPFAMENAADALRVTWCIEMPWWIRPEFFVECTPKVARFRDEILWLTEHWTELDNMIR